MKKNEITVLIVDDDVAFRNSLVEAVKRFGYRVSDTGKPDEALSLVKIKQYHAAVVDCMLPKLNGVDLAVEMRKSRFGQAPVILMSGVFRDRSFSNEAIERTKAKAFLHKPVDLSDLKTTLDDCFKDLLTSESMPLQVLISKNFSSARERTKVIEGLEEVKGFDLPFVICVLMEANASGHLNIANASGELFGITFNQGKVAKVDSSDSFASTLTALIEKKLVTVHDIQALGEKANRGDIIATLVEQEYLSPHVLPMVRKDQISRDLIQVFVDEPVKINFVPDRIKGQGFGLDLEELTPILHTVLTSVISESYLADFFKDWLDHPVQVGPHFDKKHPIFQLPLLRRVPGLADYLTQDLTLEEICSAGKYPRKDFFRALHMLVFRQMVIFHDVKKTKSVVEYGERMKNVLKDLTGKNPFEVFAYFGAGELCKEVDVERIYKEFARANHPDLLPPNTPADLRKVVDSVFSIVSEASNILTHAERRAKLIEDAKHKDAEVQIHAEGLAEEALLMLRRGRAAEALLKTKEALQRHPSRTIKIVHSWALLKAPGSNPAEVDTQVSKLLDSIPHEERRIPMYYFVQGLLKKLSGDLPGALAQFDKALAMDTGFLDARRERSAIADKATTKADPFNADISRIVGGFFKRKG